LGLTLKEDEAADKERPEDKRNSRETSGVIPCPPQGQAQSDCQLLIAASSIVESIATSRKDVSARKTKWGT
jgi:hypothetical protein